MLGMVWRGDHRDLQVDQRVERAVAQTRGSGAGGGGLGPPECPEAPPAADKVRPRLGDASRGIGRRRGGLPPWLGGLGKGWSPPSHATGRPGWTASRAPDRAGGRRAWHWRGRPGVPRPRAIAAAGAGRWRPASRPAWAAAPAGRAHRPGAPRSAPCGARFGRLGHPGHGVVQLVALGAGEFAGAPGQVEHSATASREGQETTSGGRQSGHRPDQAHGVVPVLGAVRGP